MNIAPNLSRPLVAATFVTSTQGILAQKGAGKSYTGSVEAEELLEAGQQIVVIDPTGAWWGLRSNAAGDGPGYPISILGGDHGDAPLEVSAGARVAEAIVDDGFSCILDVSDWMPEDAVDFVADFLRTFFLRNRVAVHLFVDEADLFAPQSPEIPGQKRSLAALNAIVRRGRKKGIGCTMITQRAALISKNVISQVDMLTILRTQYVGDIETIEAWIKVHADKATARGMLASLPTLTREAWLWSPGLSLFERAAIRARRTFDSGRTPEAGERIAAPRVLAPVDIARLGESIAATVARAKENDPKALREEVARLTAELAKALAAVPRPPPPVPPSVITALHEAKARIGHALDALDTDITHDFPAWMDAPDAKANRAAIQEAHGPRESKANGKFAPNAGGEMSADLQRRRDQRMIDILDRLDAGEQMTTAVIMEGEPGKLPISAVAHAPGETGEVGRRKRKANGGGGGGALKDGHRRILTALAQYPAGRNRAQIALLAGYSHKGGSFQGMLLDLRSSGAITGGAAGGDGVYKIAPPGARALGKHEALPTGPNILRYWCGRLPKMEASILRTLLPGLSLERSLIAKECRYAETGGSFQAAISKLSTLGLIVDTGGHMFALAADFNP